MAGHNLHPVYGPDGTLQGHVAINTALAEGTPAELAAFSGDVAQGYPIEVCASFSSGKHAAHASYLSTIWWLGVAEHVIPFSTYLTWAAPVQGVEGQGGEYTLQQAEYDPQQVHAYNCSDGTYSSQDKDQYHLQQAADQG